MSNSIQEKISYTSNFDYHLRQYETPYQSTLWLIDYLKRTVDTDAIKTVIDMGCGGGANIHWLKQAFPHWEFTGIDFDPEAVAVGKKQNPDEKFQCEDILNLSDGIKSQKYDLVLSIQVILTAPFDLYIFLDIAKPLAKKDIVITSLFSEDHFEQDTIRRDLKKGTSYCYKIDSLKRLEEFVEGQNITLSSDAIHPEKDIPKPDPLRLSTYTIRTKDDELIQVSPYMLMPWYAVHLEKGEE